MKYVWVYYLCPKICHIIFLLVYSFADVGVFLNLITLVEEDEEDNAVVVLFLYVPIFAKIRLFKIDFSELKKLIIHEMD